MCANERLSGHSLRDEGEVGVESSTCGRVRAFEDAKWIVYELAEVS